MSDGITPKQKKVLDFITTFINDNGYSPSLAEISQATQIKSRSSVHAMLNRLISRGLLLKTDYEARSLQLPSNDNNPEVMALRDQLASVRIWIKDKEEWDRFYRANPNHADNSEFYAPRVAQSYAVMLDKVMEGDDGRSSIPNN
jgi:SOS-response transcriptional repressor LexA